MSGSIEMICPECNQQFDVGELLCSDCKVLLVDPPRQKHFDNFPKKSQQSKMSNGISGHLPREQSSQPNQSEKTRSNDEDSLLNFSGTKWLWAVPVAIFVIGMLAIMAYQYLLLIIGFGPLYLAFWLWGKIENVDSPARQITEGAIVICLIIFYIILIKILPSWM